MNLALVFAAVAIPSVAAAPAAIAERACVATGFSGGVYFDSSLHVSADIYGQVNQTITATIVDKATCIPYTRTDLAIDYIAGSAFDRSWNYDPTHGLGFSSVRVNGSNTVSFVATTPNGGTNLALTIIGQFTPGGLENFQYALNSLGVVFTVA